MTCLGVVYANSVAEPEFAKSIPNFPVNSMIVREKFLFGTNGTPQLVITMIKREKGFSPDTADWEFFVFHGPKLEIQKRETKGSCSECHVSAKSTDWVFRKYLDGTGAWSQKLTSNMTTMDAHSYSRLLEVDSAL